MSDLGPLADTVRKARKHKGWGQQELAERAQVSLGVVSNLERGKTKPQPGNLRAIMAALDVDGYEQQRAELEELVHYPRDIEVVRDVIGMYLLSIPDEQRAAEVFEITREVFNRARAQEPRSDRP